MTVEQALKTLKRNLCSLCSYNSNMESCDIRYCDNRDAIKTLEQEFREDDVSENLCNSCINTECMLQSGIVRKHCDFYKEENKEEELKKLKAELDCAKFCYALLSVAGSSEE